MKKDKKTATKNPDVTERKRTQDEFNTLFEVTPELICLVGFDGYFKRLNPSWEKTLGYSMKELLSKPFIDFIHADDRDATNAEVAKLAQGDRTLHFENRYRCKDGSYRYFSWAATPVMEDKLIYCVAHDITERRRVEEALAESEKKLRVLFETMSEGIVYEDHDGKIISANPAAEMLLGLSLDQMQGRTSLDPRWQAIHEDGSPFPGETHSLNVAAKTGKPATGEVMGIYNPKLGDYVWLSVNSTPEFLPGEKEPFRAYAVFRDITKRKQTEEGLAAAQQLYRELFENVNIGILRTTPGPQGAFIDMNPAMVKLFEADSREQLMALHPSQIYWDPSQRQIISDAIVAKGFAREDVKFKTLKGKMLWCHINTTKKTDANGKVYFDNTIEDFTEHKQAEETILREKQFADTVIDSMPGVFYLIDEKGRFVRLNQNMSKATGYSSEELLRFKATDIIAEEDRELIAGKIGAVFKKGYENVEAHLLTKDMRKIPYYFTGIPAVIGDKTYLIGMGIDITERKQAEEALYSSKAFLNSVIEQSPESLWVSDSEGTMIRMNPACRELFGIIDEEVIGKYNLFKDNLIEAQGFMPLVEAVFRKGEIARFTIDYDLPRVEHIKVSGAMHRIIDVVISPIKDLSGKVTNAIIQHKDVTDRKRAETALRESEEGYRTTLMSVGDGVITTDAEGRVRLLNPVAETLTGWSQEDARGRPLKEVFRIVNEETRKGVEDPVSRVVREGMVVGLANHTLLIARDGKEHPIADSGAPIRNATGALTGVVLVFRDQTAERAADRALQENSAKFRDTVKYLDEGYYSCTMEGLVLDHNLAFNRILGIDLNRDMKGAKLPDFWQDPEDRKVYLKEFMATGSINIYPINAKKSNGEKIVVLASSHLVKDEKGNPVRIDGTFLDITERKRAEEELEQHRHHLEQLVGERTADLKRSEEKFRTVSDFTYDWEYWIGPDRNIIYMSPSCERITGFPPEKFYDDPGFMDTIVHLEDKPSFEKHVDTSHYDKQHEEACEIEFRIDSRDGSVKWMAHACRPIIGEDGTYKGRRVSNRDITERKNIEERLLRLQAEQQIILDSIPAWVFYKDKENRFIRVNNAFTKVMEMSREQIEGKSCFDFYPKEQAEAFLSDDLAVIDSGKPKRNIIESMDSPKGTVWVQTDKIPYRDAQGKIIGIIGFTLDITERKKAENEIIELNVALTRRKTELEASNKELESFAYSVSHDLRAPLRTIDGFSLALLEDYDDKLDVQGKNYLRRVRASTQMMAQLIDDMLKLSRITRTEMNIDKVDLTRIARSVIDELQKSQPERLINIKIADGLEDTADPRLMRIALENLLGNAWKFTGKQPEAVIEFGATKEGGRKVYFIRDNGAGFDMAYVDKLFAPFQRLHTMEEYPGTGIGLATVRRIINRHGGRVWAEGQVGKGATFYFSLQG